MRGRFSWSGTTEITSKPRWSHLSGCVTGKHGWVPSYTVAAWTRLDPIISSHPTCSRGYWVYGLRRNQSGIFTDKMRSAKSKASVPTLPGKKDNGYFKGNSFEILYSDASLLDQNFRNIEPGQNISRHRFCSISALRMDQRLFRAQPSGSCTMALNTVILTYTTKCFSHL